MDRFLMGLLVVVLVGIAAIAIPMFGIAVYIMWREFFTMIGAF